VSEARALGYTIWVMHVGVDSPDLSVARVAHRVGTGGHDVPESKIRERYDRSAPLIREAVHLADIGLVYDNSVAGRPPKLVLTFERSLLVRVRPNPSVWIGRTYVADILGASYIDDTE
jgi:predicted ABC-type ATPase